MNKMAAPMASRFASLRFQQNIVLPKQWIAKYCQPTTANKEHVNDADIEPKRYLGQPSSFTHPHLIKPGEVTSNITKEEFYQRRLKLMTEIQKTKDSDHMVIIPSVETIEMSPDVPYFFRQDTDFLYLAGFQEPYSALVLEIKKGESPEEHRSSLFVRERNPQKELWGGARTGSKDVLGLTGVDYGHSIRDIFMYYQTYLEQDPDFTLWYKPCLLGPLFHSEFSNVVKRDAVSCKSLIHNVRVIKSQAEIELMQTSCDIASNAFMEVFKMSQPQVNEHHLFTKMDYECRMQGAEFLAYPPVVAGGNRACTIHYINNNQFIREGELVLMDAGCEYRGYASDITRTWPVSGKFTASQRKLYDAVLRVQLACIRMCVVGSTLDGIYTSMVEFIAEEMKTLKLVSSQTSSDNMMLHFAARQLCPHHVGHYLGMDVHDTDSVSRSRPLEHGMVITVEPGLYIKEDDTRFSSEFRGIGIRIEDDILITDNGPVVLTKNCPKDPDEIEDLVSQNM